MSQQNENFLSAGVEPGGLYSREQIRLLLCWLVRHCAEPLRVSVAELSFAEEGLANYFEFRAALDELLRSGQLTADQNEGGESVLALPEAYWHAVEELARELPRRVRDRALHTAEQLQERERRERDNQISVYPLRAGGYYVTFRQGDGSEMLMSVTVYLADRAHVESVKARFLAQPGKLYEAVIRALDGPIPSPSAAPR
ncbi:MAG: DUF4364 family protein [Oscillospiraceae bacterium]|nr:DUF4364 family protein [Oscillospiraceae bacterium]